MNEITRISRLNQFDEIDTEYSEYKPKIKIIKPNGETDWIAIEEAELQAIKDLLTK